MTNFLTENTDLFPDGVEARLKELRNIQLPDVFEQFVIKLDQETRPGMLKMGDNSNLKWQLKLVALAITSWQMQRLRHNPQRGENVVKYRKEGV